MSLITSIQCELYAEIMAGRRGKRATTSMNVNPMADMFAQVANALREQAAVTNRIFEHLQGNNNIPAPARNDVDQAGPTQQEQLIPTSRD